MKEFEKLLLEAEHRKIKERALTMVELGLFIEKKEVSIEEIDFSILEEINSKKLYKGVFRLYENQSTGDLFYINPLVEDNKGDDRAEKTLEPYAYQVLELENVTDEEYKQVLQASQTERSGFLGIVYRAQIVMLIVTVIAAVLFMINQLTTLTTQYSFGLAFYYTLTDYMLSPYCLIGIQLCAFLISSITYRKFKKGN